MRYLIAHRSLDDHKYKENSINAALDCLNKKYISGIEIDVRMTKDHKIVMYHNLLYNLNSISSLDYKRLKDVDLLENLLKQIKTNKIILLDIKSETNNYQKFVRKLLKLIKKYPLNYYLCSFNYQLIQSLKAKTDYPLGIFVTDFINKKKDYHDLSFLALSVSSYFDIAFKCKMVWTVNSPKNINKYEYIITNKAHLLL